MSNKIQAKGDANRGELVQETDIFSDLETIKPTDTNRSSSVNETNSDYTQKPFEQDLPTLTLELDSFYTPEETVILPLYSKIKGKHVPERSGLNQWNARGRARHPDEVYIPIPAAVHKESPTFFPERDEPFDLNLPNGTKLSSKVCQQGRKALMSDPNRALGNWLLRSVFKLSEYELLTLEHLTKIGFDSVRVTKRSNSYYIDIGE
ncbi:restriction endonuclease PLD domain-containing protein [Vibrio breoganii]|uniref:restriction endonuclease PLD domain-containing protein n=1 Tax=Vibrio breoganii TaxID=553239 RepID=UPI000C832B14|nr:restriction endonuclease PLD domain-containing protein [Vibrio breoganii]PMK37664.1 hypothetical protein BCU00_18060 [Vibrio breoganii]